MKAEVAKEQAEIEGMLEDDEEQNKENENLEAAEGGS